jgi:quercetin dioxygenase-like cupin family protein
MEVTEVVESKVFRIVDIIEYVPNAAISKIIYQKTTGAITIFALNAGENLTEKNSPFRKFIQIIDGAAELVIRDKKHILKSGEAIMIPANSSHTFNAIEKFKMISTIIKSGYE